MDPGQTWEDDACRAWADEYDAYLLNAAGQLRRGVPEEEVARYLAEIQTKHMCIGRWDAALIHAREVVAAIQADDELWTLPEQKS